MILKNVCDVFSGYAFKNFNKDKNGRPVIKIGNINYNGTVSLNDCDYSTENPNNRFESKANDIYIALSGATTGKIGLMTEKGYLINQRVGIVRRTDESIPIKYLLFFLQSKTNKILDDAAGAAQPNISPKDISNYTFKIRTIDEMNSIADYLSLLKNEIVQLEIKLDSLNELIKSRFIEMFGDPDENSFGWEVVTINDVCSSIVRGPFGSALKKEFFVEKTDSTVKVYEQQHAIKKDASLGTYYVTYEKYLSLKRFECVAGDILMSCSGTMGELYQLPVNCEKGIINQALCKFTLNNKMLSRVFLESMKYVVEQMDKKGSGIQNIAAVGYVKSMKLCLPPMNKQIEFVDFYNLIDKSKFIIQKEIDDLQELLNKKMDEYFGSEEES